MTPASKPKSSRLKVQEYRDRLRSQSLRPIQIWALDVRSPAFQSETHRQCVAVASSPRDRDNQAFRLRITNAALRTLDFRGGLDPFLLTARDEDLSPRALTIKRQVKAKAAEAKAAS